MVAAAMHAAPNAEPPATTFNWNCMPHRAPSGLTETLKDLCRIMMDKADNHSTMYGRKQMICVMP